ncbi:MAG: hypothetical protein IJ442_08335 [Bacteroidaceae bacterium]|nr:hypothetical protein [Bacteroidaceae bacterium]
MKKIISLVLLSILVITNAVAQSKKMEKSLWKAAKKEAKALKKEGWKADSSMPLENILFEHYKKLTTEGNHELVGNVIGNTSVQTLNQGQQWATTMVCISYAKEAGILVRGRLAAEVGAAVNGGPSADSFYEGYESKVEKEIQGEIKKSFALYKEKKEGGIDYKAFFIVNEENAHKARIRAMQMAMEESEFARENAERISKYVNEAFTVEQK